MSKRLLLTGLNLTCEDFGDVVLHHRPVALHPDARRAMAESRALVDRLIAERNGRAFRSAVKRLGFIIPDGQFPA